MKRFIEGLDRTQTTLSPDCVDDYVGQDTPVRAINAFVDMLDLGALGFDIEPEVTGRRGSTLQRCSRSTSTATSTRFSHHAVWNESARNLELIWLTGQLKPDFKTIADFRKDKGASIKKVCRQFMSHKCGDPSLNGSSNVTDDRSRFRGETEGEPLDRRVE